MISKARSNSCSGDQYVELGFPAPAALAKVTGLCPDALSHICFGAGRSGFASPRPLRSDQLSLTNLQGSASSKGDYTLITTREPPAIADLLVCVPLPSTWSGSEGKPLSQGAGYPHSPPMGAPTSTLEFPLLPLHHSNKFWFLLWKSRLSPGTCQLRW